MIQPTALPLTVAPRRRPGWALTEALREPEGDRKF